MESEAGVHNIDAIAAVEGIDACLIGPNDLANSLGVPGELFHERDLEAVRSIARAVRAAGTILGLHGPDRMTEMLIDEGLTLIMSGHDAGLLTGAMREIAARYGGR
ncbi:MAG: aldolase/citrate lyase family protein [Spirochaetota bacterium]